MANSRAHGFICPHAHIGTIAAGNPYGDGPYAAVSTCADCVREAQRHIHDIIGIPAGELITFDEHRAMRKEA